MTIQALLRRWFTPGPTRAERTAAELERAVALHESGHLDEAEKLYLDIIDRDPRHAEALHLIGVAQHQRGHQGAALSVIDEAIAITPRKGLFHFNRGNVLNALGESRLAATSFETATRMHARHMPSWLNLGRTRMQLHEHAKAAEALWQAFNLDPSVPGLRFELATALIAAADRGAAVGTTAGAPVVEGGNKRLHGEAAQLLRDFWQEAPDPPGARLMLAHALEEKGDLSEASAHFRALAEDEKLSREARRLAHGNLANCCNRLGLMPDAVLHYRAALELMAAPATDAGDDLSPESSPAPSSDTAPDPSPASAVTSAPASSPLASDLASNSASDEASNTMSAIATGMAYDPHVTPQVLLEAHREWARRFAPPLPDPASLATNAWPQLDRSSHRRLRICYLSPDFRRHPVSSLLAAALEQHDRSQVEVFCYYNFHGADDVTERIKAAVPHWRHIVDWKDDEVERMIHHDRIDILVDLAGHTHRNRLPALARKPAPVMVEWLGYYCTTGVPAFDWFLTDPWSSPAGQEAWFTEKLHRLPRTRFTYEPYAFMPPVNNLPAQGNGHVTFGCLNNLAKVNTPVLSLWARVLEANPTAHLVLQAQALDDGPNRERFAVQAAACGLPMQRVELRGFVPLDKAAQTYHGIDVALDPFPFCGGMTSLEALWMGVPVVTLEQPLVAGRQTLSMLHNLGLEDCIAANEQDYVAIASRLAADVGALAELRRTLRSRMRESPLMDYPGFARELEAAYRDIWREFLALSKPD